MPNDTVDAASAFVIRELSGEGRSVRLVGRALPYRPFSLVGNQRVETTWYPGNPIATATVLGAEEESTSINGWWKDKYLGVAVGLEGGNVTSPGANQTVPFTVSGERVQTARRAAEVVDSIRRQGQPVEVTWDVQARRGHLTKFEQSWHNAHDLEWKIEFTWTGFVEQQGTPTFNQETSVSETADTLERTNSQLADASVPTVPLANGFGAALAGRLASLTSSVADAQGAVTNLTLGALTPFDAARRTVAVANGVVEQADALLALLGAQPPRTLLAIAAPAAATFGQIVASEVYVRRMQTLARRMRREATIRRQVLLAGIQAELLAAYSAREGEDLRDVSRLFYNTPFEWRRLMAFNELTSAALAAGQLVLVPRLQRGDS